MNKTLKKILAIITCIVVIVGWFITVQGTALFGGEMNSVKDVLSLGLDIEGGAYVVMEADIAKGEDVDTVMSQTQAVIENRVNEFGLSEASVTVEGTNRIRVEMPGVDNADQLIEKIGTTAKLSFYLADETKVLDGDDIADASVGTDSDHGGYLIQLEFTSKGATKFEDATKKASSGEVTATMTYGDGQTKVENNAIVIMLDNEVISAPTCKETISGTSCIITQNKGFSKEDASTTASLIRGGALPAELTQVTASVQSATIGYDAFDKAVLAGAIGLLLVFLIMILFYKGLGLIADIALALYVLLDLWAMVAMGATLTLPGIAGIILSIGMAVDANVIIFARIKEEIGQGRSVRVAVSSGFKRALTTVLDAQITTLIAAVVLYEIGTTTVRGFATTLMLGIIISIFTAVVVTQLFVSLFADSKKFGTKTAFGCNEDGTPRKILKKQFDFVGNRKIFYCISAGVLIVGLLFGLLRGFNTGIDFSGGTMMQIDMHKTIDIDELKANLSDYNLDDATIVYAGEENEQVIIKTKQDFNAAERTKIMNTIEEKYEGVTDEDLLTSEQFGPSIGDELKGNAVKSVLIAALGMLIYIIFRFKSWKYGVTSIAGVLHDALILVACYAIFSITVNNPLIASILTVVGYSINDTIVIFDRIRENKNLNRAKESNYALMNRSINQTLDRSIMTSVTTVLVMIPLLFIGSSSILEFTIPLLIGVTVGTYSSIFLCTPLCYETFKGEDKSDYQKKLERKEKEKKAQAKKENKLNVY
ncbi:MAG: protein translocase subunit SecD [Clostridia bacterium]|nr:protein translocase subunit SecD [Clostridia bacterium]